MSDSSEPLDVNSALIPIPQAEVPLVWPKQAIEAVGLPAVQTVEVPADAGRNKLQRVLHAGKRAAQLTMIGLEISPANEAIRFAAFGIAEATTQSTPISAAVLGATTFAVEGLAVLATADIITTEKSTKMFKWINRKLDKHVRSDIKMNPVAEFGVAMVGGASVVLAEKQREDPARTAGENRRHGLFTAGWMGAFFTVEGALLAEGINNYDDIKKVGPCALAFAGVTVLVGKATKRVRAKESVNTDLAEAVGTANNE